MKTTNMKDHSFGKTAQPLKQQKDKMAKKMKEGFHKGNLPKAKRIDGGGFGFSYKDLKK